MNFFLCIKVSLLVRSTTYFEKLIFLSISFEHQFILNFVL